MTLNFPEYTRHYLLIGLGATPDMLRGAAGEYRPARPRLELYAGPAAFHATRRGSPYGGLESVFLEPTDQDAR